MMNQSISQQLSQARQARNLSLEEVSKAIRIREPLLEAMEAGEFDALPSAVQARGFLRTYAEYLGLNPEPMLEILGARLSSGHESPFRAAMHVPTEPEFPVDEESLAVYQAKKSMANVAVFAEIGKQLRSQREALGLSLLEIEEQTYIRSHYLLAMENGNFASLPSSVQGRGMLKNYAAYLGLDQDTLLLQFADGLQQSFHSRQTERTQFHQLEQPQQLKQTSPATKPKLTTPRRIFSTDLFWGILLFCLLAGFVGWGVFTVLSLSSKQTQEPTPPSIADVLLSTPSPTVTATLPAPIPSSAAIFYPTVVITSQATTEGGTAGENPAGETSPGKVHINISARQRAWLRVIVDGKIKFQGRTEPGSAYTYSANDQIEIVTGNAGAIQVLYNNEDLGTLGYMNEVVNRIYTAQGALNPTPTITLTPTITSTPTITPRATAVPKTPSTTPTP